MDVLNVHGVPNFNAIERMQEMNKRDKMHFNNSALNRTVVSEILHTAILISDGFLLFGLAKHLTEMAQRSPTIRLRNASPLPAVTQDAANDEVRSNTLAAERANVEQRVLAQQRTAGRVLRQVQRECPCSCRSMGTTATRAAQRQAGVGARSRRRVARVGRGQDRPSVTDVSPHLSLSYSAASSLEAHPRHRRCACVTHIHQGPHLR